MTTAAAVAVVLTSLSLSPTLATGEWLAPLIATVAVIALAAGGARHTGLPRWAVTAVAAAALLVGVTVLFARDVAILGVVPGPAAWERFASLLEDGTTLIWQVAPPVPATRGIEFVIAAGVGAVAVVVDAVAVTWRRAAAAGLPLLVLYLVPASVLPDGVPWPLFVVGALGWIGLLLSDGQDRLSRWGRIVAVRGESDRVSTSVVGGTGRRLAAVAVAVAVAVPLALPMLSEGVLGTGTDGTGEGDGGEGEAGLRRIVTVNPLVNLRRDLVRGEDVVVLRYATEDPTPEYLRIATLDQFDGRTWTLEQMEATAAQQASAGLPNPPGLTDEVLRAAVSTEVDVVALNSPRLPLPYPVTRVDIDGDWRWDGDSFDVFTPEVDGTAQGVSYRADSLAVVPTADQLRAAGAADSAPARYTELPPETALELADLTDEVVSGATTSYDAALQLQSWFRSAFTYSLERRGGNGLSDLQAFLSDRSGYCEQFAATMALMARVEGIPSRVQVGFTPGTRLDDGTWEVTAHDAHAWPELWFDGVGWVRFEPTPGGGDGGRAPSWAPLPVQPGLGPEDGSGGGRRDGGFVLRRDAQEGPGAEDRRFLPTDGRRPGEAAGGGAVAPQEDPGVPLWPFAVAAGLLAGLLAAAPWAAQRVTRRRRWAAATGPALAAEAAWRDVLDTAADVDLGPDPTETPRDVARRLPGAGSLSQGGRAALAELAQRVERGRYAPAGPDDTSVAELRRLAAVVCDDLLAVVPPRDRRRARWWPASGRARVAEAVGAVGARVDSVMAAVGRRVRMLSGRARRGGDPTALRSGA